jgi:hypothetical protein
MRFDAERHLGAFESDHVIRFDATCPVLIRRPFA